MANVHLKYLGLNDGQIELLKKLIQSKHPKGGMQTAAVCACGRGSGGPNGTEYCQIYKLLMDSGEEVSNGRDPYRDPSICDHNSLWSLTYQLPDGKWVCERCRSYV